MKLHYVEAEARVRDAARVAEARERNRTKVERSFAPIRERAAKNAEEMNKARGYLAPW